MKEEIKKAIIYCRVSSREQEETGYSLDAQEKLLKDYAAKNGLSVIKIFKISESASGRQIRKTFNEMLQYTAKNKISIILCEKIDRLTRNLKDAALISDWISESQKQEVHFVKENFIVSQNTKAHENLVWDMKVAIARFYTNNLSEEVRKGQKEKLEQGWFPQKPLIGYKTVGEKGHKIHVINEKEAPHIKRMFEWYATGNYSLARLDKELYEAGLRQRSGRRIPISRIHLLLQEPFYYGKIKWMGNIYPGKHEPLIDKDLFDKVQTILIRKIKNPHYTKHNPLFKAKICCEHCGGMLTWEIQKGHWYGHCNNHSGSRKCEAKTYIRQEEAEKQLVECFEKLAPKNEEVLSWIEDVIRKENAEHVAQRETEVKRLNNLLFQIRKQKDKYFEARINREVPIEYCERKIAECTEEEEALEATLIRTNDFNDEYQQLKLVVHELAYKAKEIYEKANVDEKRLLMSQIFANLIQNHYEIKPEYTLAAEYLAKWMPIVNPIFEPKQNTAETVVSGDALFMEPSNHAMEPSKAQNDFRTSRKSPVKARHEHSILISRPLLPN